MKKQVVFFTICLNNQNEKNIFPILDFALSWKMDKTDNRRLSNLDTSI